MAMSAAELQKFHDELSRIQDEQAYMKAFDKLSDEQATAYLKWQAAQPDVPTSIPQLNASDVVSTLQSMDFTQPAMISNFTTSTLYGQPVLVPLVKDQSVEYAVRFGSLPMEKTPLKPSAAVMKISQLHFDLFELVVDAKPRPQGSPNLPKYVFEVGPLLIKSLAQPSSVFQETGYIVFVDATTVDKSVWVVYDYRPHNEMGEAVTMPLERSSMVFPPVSGRFDVAQLLRSVKEWNKTTVSEVEQTVQKSAALTNPRVTTAVRADVDKALNSRSGG